MNSSKLKWFLIAIFLAANIFFFIQYHNYSKLLNSYTERELDTAVENLNKRGVKIDRSAITQAKTVPPVLKLEYADNSIESLAKQVMNGSFASYMLPSGISYTNDSETLIFFDSHSFEYTVTGTIAPDENVIELLRDGDSEQMKPYVKALHSRLFNQPITAPYKTTLKLVSFYIADERVIIRVKQEINGITIDRSEIIALFERSELKYIKGNVFISDEVSELEADSLDIVNLLFKIEKSDSEIVKIDKVYHPVTTDNGSLYLTPSYMLTYENGNVHVWDATSSTQRY
ncbi:MAG: hypothetical protein IJP16_09735 [Clostridia bacterium]|nr:hypothetical protein [Clostridia bacterium]